MACGKLTTFDPVWRVNEIFRPGEDGQPVDVLEAIWRRNNLRADGALHIGPGGWCRHTPDETYTRYPCSCGREIWPPRGRGRGESLLSPRRIEAKIRAGKALALHLLGVPYRDIATRLGYKHASGAFAAVQRLRDKDAEWERWEAETGRRLYHRHQPTLDELLEALAELEAEFVTGGLDGQRLMASLADLRRILHDYALQQRDRKRTRLANRPVGAA
jgi:hypothetical protein